MAAHEAHILDLSVLESGEGSPGLVLRAQWLGDVAVETIDAADDLADLARLREAIDGTLRATRYGEEERVPGSWGSRFWSFLIRGRVRDLYSRLPADEHVRICLLSNSGRVKSMPWEYGRQRGPLLPDPHRSWVRIVPTVGARSVEPRELDRALRILFVWSDPYTDQPVRWDDTQRTIRRVFDSQFLDSSTLSQGLEMEVVEGRRGDLRARLARESYDVLHFVGHGEVGRDGQARIVLTDPTGGPDRILPEELVALLGGRELQLVILSACYGSARRDEEGLPDFAEALVESYVPAVVANQLALPNDTVAVFARALYEELLASGDVDRGLGEARVALAVALEARHSSLEWGVPTLTRRLGAARLFRVAGK